MGYTKKLFLIEQESYADTHKEEIHQQQQELIQHQESSESFNNNSATDILNDVFTAYGKIFGSNKKSQ